MKKILIMVVIAVLCSSMFPTIVVRAQTTPDVSLVPSTSTPKIFDTFTANITVSNVEDLWTWQAGLQWDPNVLNFTSFTFGAGLTGSTNDTLVITPNVTNNVMVWPALQTEASITGTTPLTSSGPVVLATVNFTTLALGDSTVNLTDVALNGRNQTTTTTAYNPDINRNNVDGLSDLVWIAQCLTKTNKTNVPYADVNNDSAINITDFAIVGDDYGGHVDPGSDWTSYVIYDIAPTVQNCSFTVVLNTPVGSYVPVSLPDVGVNLNFTSVTGSGITDATTSNTGPPPPANFNVTGPDGEPLYYQITTTATYTGSIQIAITYDPSIPSPQLMHYDGSMWVDVTTFVDAGNHIIYGQVPHFSIFAVMGPTPPDVAVTNVTSSNTVVGQGFSTSLNVPVTNQGDYAETFNVTTYANTTIIASENVTLPAGNSTIAAFAWNTTGFAYGNYTISATAGPLPGETNTTNNNFTEGVVTVTIPGDINGDFNVTLADLVLLANAYSTTPASGGTPGTPHAWNPNADINNDGKVSLSDLVILANHYRQHYP